ncbi:gamma-glutamyl-gamma-aminobutyrate hydrolase family protein [Chitiniphilus purpureus]|uniref:Gamma-glutamyl-gamma-aminobutyrate hydrolase family protein n=1 Tax=Chitiniphilus purpureus TaxID=2981137 RepID=A0ABY6DH79_9NEIS|nr:gamma-glutamyl-gamma-aminobutyrate hydrolase family protein [Chitiniphilus sp. CD1]UXY13699.1 gamma-glutamyl-gamma-aminobutyrate hydrolase family protein [Chitiniphilus sp. CD1]
MKPVLISQRVDVWADRNERRDALDRRLVDMLAACGLLAVPVPNCAVRVGALWRTVAPAGVVLSGGNDLALQGGETPERDATERALLDLAVASAVPVLGICHGLQVIVDYFGGTLVRVDGHVAVRHPVAGKLGEFEVNSYHNWGVRQLPAALHALARAPDGSIEALRHAELPMLAVMWHPEREAVLAPHDRHLIEHHFA